MSSWVLLGAAAVLSIAVTSPSVGHSHPGAAPASAPSMRGVLPARHGRCEERARHRRITQCRHPVLRPGAREALARRARQPDHPLFLVDRMRAIPADYPIGEQERWRSCRDPEPVRRGDLVCLPVPYTNRWTALRRLAWEGPKRRPRLKRTHDGLTVGHEGRTGFRALMDAAMAEAGAELFITSAFRPYAVQRAIFEDHVRREIVKGLDRAEAIAAATAYSAQPGHSEHQLGTTVDFTYRRPDGSLSGFGGFMAHEMHRALPMKWLRDNAHRFGVVQTYRHDRVASSQYVWEPWHWRYIGVEAADAAHACDLGLSEILTLIHRAKRPTMYIHQRLVAQSDAAIAPWTPSRVAASARDGVVRVVAAGHHVQQRWFVTNLGGRQWDGVALKPLLGDAAVLGSSSRTLRYPGCVPVWSSRDVTLSVVAPTQPGRYQARWELVTSDGDPLGEVVLTLVVVP